MPIQLQTNFKGVRSILCFTVALFLVNVHISSQIKQQRTDSENIDEMVSMIQTAIDPDFVYEYEQTKFVPSEGKTLLIMGQTVEAITEYENHFSEQQLPGGWSAYWGITEFKGVTESYLNEVGVTHNHQMLVDKFPNTVIQSACWMVGKWDVAKKAGEGEFDEVVRQYSTWAKSANRPIFLRIGYEFDGPHNELEPKDFVKAYRRIVDILREEGVENIAFVWHSYAYKPYKDYPLSSWYPGDEYVDWVGMSVFYQPYYGAGLGPYGDAILKFAKTHKKPVMIAESNPIFGIEKNNVDAWDKWFVNFFSIIYEKNIKAISFINENWEKTSIEGISEWKDSRLYSNELISRAWFRETGKDRYLKQSDTLFQHLGYLKK